MDRKMKEIKVVDLHEQELTLIILILTGIRIQIKFEIETKKDNKKITKKDNKKR